MKWSTKARGFQSETFIKMSEKGNTGTETLKFASIAHIMNESMLAWRKTYYALNFFSFLKGTENT